VRVGEVWQLGAAQIQVCQPRTPCWKIDERFACDGMAKFIASSALTGWYWRVTQPGSVGIGATLQRVQTAANAPTLRAAMQLWQQHRPSLDDLAGLAATPGIASAWRERILQRLEWFRSGR
jgi:MOSC domain-containing protein YiiM